MTTAYYIVCAFIGTVLGLVAGLVMAILVGLLTDFIVGGGAAVRAITFSATITCGTPLGGLIGFSMGLNFPTWQHNLQRKKRLLSLRQQRAQRVRKDAGTWPPAPKEL